MAKAKFVEVSDEVSAMVSKIQNVFFERFSHVNRTDVYLIFKDAAKNSFAARTNVTNGLYRALTKKKIIIQIWKQNWELNKEVDNALLIFRELSRIAKDDHDEYKLIRPDLTDFKFLLEKIGLNHEHKDEFFSKVIPPVEAQ